MQTAKVIRGKLQVAAIRRSKAAAKAPAVGCCKGNQARLQDASSCTSIILPLSWARVVHRKGMPLEIIIMMDG